MGEWEAWEPRHSDPHTPGNNSAFKKPLLTTVVVVGGSKASRQGSGGQGLAGNRGSNLDSGSALPSLTPGERPAVGEGDQGP